MNPRLKSQIDHQIREHTTVALMFSVLLFGIAAAGLALARSAGLA